MYLEVYADLEEIYESLDGNELAKLVKWMKRDGVIKDSIDEVPQEHPSDHEFVDTMRKILHSKHRLSIEEEETLNAISRRL